MDNMWNQMAGWPYSAMNNGGMNGPGYWDMPWDDQWMGFGPGFGPGPGPCPWEGYEPWMPPKKVWTAVPYCAASNSACTIIWDICLMMTQWRTTDRRQDMYPDWACLRYRPTNKQNMYDENPGYFHSGVFSCNF